MVKKDILFVSCFFLLLGVILSLSFVSALDVKKTEITVNAGKYNNVTITILDDVGNIRIFSDFANEYGVAKFTYYSVKTSVDMKVELREYERDEIFASKDFKSQTTGASVVLEMDVENPSLEASDSGESLGTEEIAEGNDEVAIDDEVSDEAGVGLTGAVIGGGSLNFTWYIVIAVILGVSLIVTMRVISKKRTETPPHLLDKVEKDVKPVKKSEDSGEEDKNEESGRETEEKEILSADITDRKTRIRVLERQLNALKSEERIEELNKSIQKERDELEKLRKE